ncbi:heme-dependent oxidative N-demethylase family protein [Aliiroseovarius sp. 2305UL8-7]|uniref:heme-dependent oxidative N-demethylase family protein n=1 Tax=Aliiroseovarius conchicola TaxID=3121637 RepID=UPI003528216D
MEICQKHLPIGPWADLQHRKLPGLSPITEGEWLLVDDAYTAQMAYRVRLMQDELDQVHRLSDEARPAADELLETILAELETRPDFDVAPAFVRCPDGREVSVDRSQPLLTCGALVQEDFVLMQKRGGEDEHVLTGAILCFPASWSLGQKFLKPMTRIHKPVAEYTTDIARRVQRLFDGVQVGRPMWRANCLIYADPDLFQPRTEEDRRVATTEGAGWVRVERQGMRRLPQTGAVVFSIHTFVVRKSDELGESIE